MAASPSPASSARPWQHHTERPPARELKTRRDCRRVRSFYACDICLYSFAVTVTPSTFGIVFGAPIAAPMIIGKGTGFSGSALTVRFFGSSR